MWAGPSPAHIRRLGASQHAEVSDADLASVVTRLLRRTPHIPDGAFAAGEDAQSRVAHASHAARGSSAPVGAPCDDEATAGHLGRAGTVPQECADSLTYVAFVEHYMAPNRPVLIRGVTRGWRIAREWVDEAGRVDAAAMLRACGADSGVRVTDTHPRHQGCGPTELWSLEAYVRWWEAAHCNASPNDDLASSSGSVGVASPTAPTAAKAEAAPDVGAVMATAAPDETPQLLYLKDWHVVHECPPGFVPYQVPPFFQEDWLNEFHDARRAACLPAAAVPAPAPAPSSATSHAPALDGLDAAPCDGGGSALGAAAPPSSECADYRFLYLGPAGSWTPLHADVLRSFSWSVNLAGSKRWLLLPPEHTHLLHDRHGSTPPSFMFHEVTDCAAGGTPAAPADADGAAATFPGLPAARTHLLECIQGVGDALFVPSGWHHTVENLQPTLSINHNWHNAHNVHWAWALLEREHAAATAALVDCKETCSSWHEFESLVQRALAANSGMDFEGFAEYVSCIIRRRLAALRACEASATDSGHAGCAPLPVPESGAAPRVGSGDGLHDARQLMCLLDLQRASSVLGRLVRALERAAEEYERWAVAHVAAAPRRWWGATALGGVRASTPPPPLPAGSFAVGGVEGAAAALPCYATVAQQLVLDTHYALQKHAVVDI